MPAYLISLCREVTDRRRLEDYWANVAPAFKGFEAKPLVAYAPFEILEGEGGVLGVVLFEFPSMEEARRWYISPAYQEVKKRREGAANFDLVLVEGGVVPAAERMRNSHHSPVDKSGPTDDTAADRSTVLPGSAYRD